MQELVDRAGVDFAILNRLYAIEESLTQRPFEFIEWTMCTCSHVFFGSTGREPIRDEEVSETSTGPYCDVLRYIMDSNSLVEKPGSALKPTTSLLVLAVSDATTRAAPGERTTDPDPDDLENDRLRQGALILVRNAIHRAEIEAERAWAGSMALA
jgi:hypothetical protein